jgi:FkbM family methyltransferase
LKAWRGWKFPDSEHHLIEWMTRVNDVRRGRPTYQAHKYDAALSHTPQRRVAIDIGANIGLWSWLMANDFTTLHAFEPVAAYRACWAQNVVDGVLHPMALGERAGTVSMVCMTPGSCGDTTVNVAQVGDDVGSAEINTLDSFGFEEVDLIKCDNEGYELFVMRGAEETIKRCRPTIIVEQKPGHGKTFGLSDTAAVEFLQTLGMQVRQVISGDYILTF